MDDPQTMTIRRYRPGDAAAVLDLHRTALRAVGLRPGDGVYYDHDLVGGGVDAVYLRADGEFLVGECQGRIVAMVGLRRVDADTAEVVRLRVHPAWQRRGLGRRMLRAVERRAAELGYRTLRGDTTLVQSAALRLYLASGWRETARRRVGELTVVEGEKRLRPRPPGPSPRPPARAAE
ncbi:GNAT family N-acetyltransferase [Allonocardiopsis opalescens]|uniref:Acetyltransferase (GNAT) family protein n=1 Tax=Allonocardiopsis opalescens TaxID=1144618 RepID=A0A2T0PXQ5_9ACTN|nr:GNAT family N-acetyltransferase [Allonocardiopsis opalescens]PRX96228.1 acetyltransferase (GNAT) family protein [Allonocardiopsis opalescens]